MSNTFLNATRLSFACALTLMFVAANESGNGVWARRGVRPPVTSVNISGHVRYTTGAPVQGAAVTLDSVKYDPDTGDYTDHLGTQATTTGADGFYSFSVEGMCAVEHRVEARSLEIINGEQPQSGRGTASGCVLSDSTVDPSIYVSLYSFGEDPNAGDRSCNANVGAPVNVTNGNMYIEQTDYRVPGVGPSLDITRVFNGSSRQAGLFGRGWSTDYDELVRAVDSERVLLQLPSGRSLFFSRPGATGVFRPQSQYDFRGEIAEAAGGGYTLTLKDGAVHRFNAAGRLTSVADRDNNQVTLTYGATGQLASVADPFGRTLNVSTDANGRVLSIADQLGGVATYAYGANQELLTVTYADNSQYKFAYTVVQGRYLITGVKDALDNVLEAHAYDAQGRALTSERQGGAEKYTLTYYSPAETHVTDALGRVTKYFFDTSRSLYAVTRVEGNCSCGGSRVETWAYDAQLNLTAHTDALNHTTAYTYDAAGNRLSESGPLGTTSYTYNSIGQVLTVTDPLNGITAYEYDAHGNLLNLTDAQGGVTSFAYDTRGLLQSVTDPRRNVIAQLTYDAHGNLTRRDDALNHATTFAYDARGRLTSATDAANNTTGYEYDAAGRVKTVTRPDNSTVVFTYDLAGRRTKVRDPRGHETAYEYDGVYRLTKVTDAANSATSYAYDLMSNLTGVTDPLGRVTNYTYDDFDRLTKITYPEASAGAGRVEERFTYDSDGNLTQKVDKAGRATNFLYDTANRLTKVTDPASQETRYEYDARSQVTALVDAISQRYEFTYDNVGRTTQVRRAGLTMTFAYDASGNRTQRTDYNGAATSYTYDAANRLTGISYPNAAQATYAYDALNRLTAATNQNGTVSFSYNNMGRVNSTTDVWGQTVGYVYDPNGNRTQATLGATTVATYQYDALNRPTQLTDRLGGAFAYAYDAASRLTSRAAPNGVVTTYSYDGLDRLTRLRHAKGLTAIADYQYQQDNAGRITQVTEDAGTRAYTYDALSRLTSATHPDQAAESYAYDAVGNRTASHRAPTYTYQPTNRMAAAGFAGYTYDANGRLTAKSDSGAPWHYAWDYENRLTQVTRPDGSTVSYKYDALGRRVERGMGAGEWTRFSYDGADVILDAGADGGTVEYFDGPGIDDKLWQRTSAGEQLYLLTDHLGSTRALTDAQGAVVESERYDSFGDGLSVSMWGLVGGVWGEISAVGEDGEPLGGWSARTRYGYTGREHDREAGLIYYRARWYDPQMGRFISEDPVEFRGGINWYAYVGNDPTRRRDPLGLYPSISPDDFSDPYKGERALPPQQESGCGCDKSWTDCYAQCVENHRLDNLLPILGSALPKRFLPPFRVPYPSQPLTTPLSVIAHYVPEAGVADALRGAGRAISRVATPALVFEGFYDLGLLGSCAELCYRNPCN